ncbi:TraB/GumN family protein [Bacterioplanes sanyensis]|uniref:TraB/GumN family protein n=1 Tax=Bacterioplanes sanyensis TaxID=1249553 RepID=A0A222FLG7_9GAMM|nr:TraB/GumN family protein [Bacterioplanes sanyensis]ASP39063.1 TraB/GumN family protein [Bacterioplanes sanyensis]
MIRLLGMVCVAALLWPTSLWAQTFLWQVSKGDQRIWLGGTIHLLKAEDYPLPQEFEHAYSQAQHLVFETDISALGNPQVQQKMAQRMLLQPGQSLPALLNNDARQALIRYVEKNGLSMDQLRDFSPQWVALLITVGELNRLGMNQEGVDAYFDRLAREHGKTIGELESVGEQIEFIATMAEGRESELILQTIADTALLAQQMDGLRDAWRQGDRATLSRLGLDPMRSDYPKVYDSLIVKRNNNWLPKIERLFHQQPNALVLVGALHLVGPDGLLQQLQQKGYHIEYFGD